MPQPADQACANCTYWLQLASQPGMGECRRYPPEPLKFISMGGGRICATTACKLTTIDWWCGEWHASGGPSPAEQVMEQTAQHLAAKKDQLKKAIDAQK